MRYWRCPGRRIAPIRRASRWWVAANQVVDCSRLVALAISAFTVGRGAMSQAKSDLGRSWRYAFISRPSGAARNHATRSLG